MLEGTLVLNKAPGVGALSGPLVVGDNVGTAGSDVAVAAVKSMLAAANSAYDNLTKVAKQATEIAEANVAAATETARGLAKTKKAA